MYYYKDELNNLYASPVEKPNEIIVKTTDDFNFEMGSFYREVGLKYTPITHDEFFAIIQGRKHK